MKKLLLITALFSMGITSDIFAQCTPDPLVVAANIPGMFPTPTQGMVSGTEGTAYSQNFTIIVPSDTTIVPSDFFTGAPSTPVTMTVNSNTVNSVTGLPTGLTHTCAPASCVYPGGTNGCFVVDGTPAQAGTFAVLVNITLNVDVPAFPPLPALGAQDLPAQDITYSLTIDSSGTVSIEKLNMSAFEVFPITPNPSTDGAEIKFHTPDYRDVSLTVHNMIGALVMSKQIYAEQGLNTVTFSAEDLKAGVYLVTLTDGESSSTKRMVVSSY